MVELSEDSIKQIKDNLDSVADTINEAIDDVQNNPDNKQEEKEQKQEDNIVNKEKSNLSSQEKKRFAQIGQIFIEQWMKSIEKLQAAQDKKMALVTSRKEKEPSWLKKLIDKKKSDAPKKSEKKEKSWIGRLLQVIGVLGLVYVLFKDKIDKWLPEVWAWIKDTGLKWLAIGLLVTKGIIPLVKFGLQKLSSWLISLGAKLLTVVKGHLKTAMGFLSKGLAFVGNKLIQIARAASMKLTNKLGKGSIVAITAGVLTLAAAFLPRIWDWLKETVSGMWEWIKSVIPYDRIIEYVQAAWDVFLEVIGGVFVGLKDAFQFLINAILDLPKEIVNWISGGIMGAIQWVMNGIKSLLPSWLGGGDNEEEESTEGGDKKKETHTKPEKKEPKKLEVGTKKVVDVKEIQMKDSVLETIKEVSERLNTFFSDKSGGFVDLAEAVLDQFNAGFQAVMRQLTKINIANTYEVEAEVDYDDEYKWDNSNRSVRSISQTHKTYKRQHTFIETGIVTKHVNSKNYDYRTTSNLNQSWYDQSDYQITYNTIDIPALDNAIKRLEETSREEVKLLKSQNDYLTKMIDNMDGLGNKLEYLKNTKPKEQPKNTFLPMLANQQQQGERRYNATVVKSVQSSMARALA